MREAWKTWNNFTGLVHNMDALRNLLTTYALMGVKDNDDDYDTFFKYSLMLS